MTDTIRKISEKVMDEVHDKILEPIGLAAPKKRAMWSAEAQPGSKDAKPSSNMAVCLAGPKKVTVKDVGYPKMQTPQGKTIEHGVILRVVCTNICGSDLHMYRGTAPGTTPGMTLGHEITGEVFEMGSAVERFEVGDLVSVPFNVSCGTCDNCHEMKTSACLKANPKMAGGAYGFPMMGGWQGGQAQFVLVPWADHQLLKLPKEVAMDKILSLTFLSDIFPTGYNGAVQAGVGVGSLVYVAGAGPVGLCAARSSFLLGAAEVFVADQCEDRLKLAETIGCKTINLSKLPGGKHDAQAIMAEIKRQLPSWQNGPHEIVDCSIDCIGYEACGVGREAQTRIDEQALNTIFTITKAGGKVGIPGLYAMQDLGGPNSDNKAGVYHMQFGVAWNKGLQIGMGQCPVIAHNKDLMKCIIHNRVDLEKLLNVKVITLEEAPDAYDRFNKLEACKYVIDPNGILAANRGTATSSTKAQ